MIYTLTRTLFIYDFLVCYSVLEGLATGYESDGSAEAVYDVGWWSPAGQMYSTVQDLNKVVTLLFTQCPWPYIYTISSDITACKVLLFHWCNR